MTKMLNKEQPNMYRVLKDSDVHVIQLNSSGGYKVCLSSSCLITSAALPLNDISHLCMQTLTVLPNILIKCIGVTAIATLMRSSWEVQCLENTLRVPSKKPRLAHQSLLLKTRLARAELEIKLYKWAMREQDQGEWLVL